MRTLLVKTNHRTQLIDVTREVQRAVTESGVKSGVCCLYVPHTTAGILINEHPTQTWLPTSRLRSTV